MNQSFPCTYGTIYHGTIFFYFLEKYLKKFFVLPGLLSNEKNSSDHHNSYNKGPNLAFFSFTESPSNSLLTIKFPKNHITSSYHRLPKTTNDIFVCQKALGVKLSLTNKVRKFKIHYMVMYFYCKTCSYEKKETSHSNYIACFH
jgi:hypothetical protein